MDLRKLRNPLLLLLAAIVWGTSFVAQVQGMEYVGPFTFSAVRSTLGGLVLLPVILGVSLGRRKRKTFQPPTPKDRKNLITGGILCGLLLCLASNFQQVGMALGTGAGKSGFITAFYIVMVPIFGLFLHKKSPPALWLGVLLALCGLYLLCIKEGLSFARSDFLVFLCSFLYALHILVIDKYTMLADGVKMACIQFFVCGLLSAIPMFLFETPQLNLLLSAWFPIAYSGIMSCGVAYTLQIVGQKGVNPALASLIMSLESVVSVLSGWIILGQKLGTREFIGCCLMFAAVLLVQCIPQKASRQQAEEALEPGSPSSGA